MTKEERTAIRARCEAATPGPWEVDYNLPLSESIQGIFAEGHGYVLKVDILDEDVGIPAQADVDFVAHAREDIPWLLAQLERVTAERDAYERIGTMEEFARLVDKAIPIKPFKESLGDRLCNSCGAGIGWDALNDSLRFAPRYCSNCGQPIDWSDEEGR